MAPKKGYQEWTPKRGATLFTWDMGTSNWGSKIALKIGYQTDPTRHQFHAFSCNTWIGKEAVIGKVPMRPFQAFRKRFKYVRWDGGSPWKGKHARFSTASGRPSGTKSKACLTSCCLVGATPYSTFWDLTQSWSRYCIMKSQARHSSYAGGSVLNRAISAAEVAANKALKASFGDTAMCAITRGAARER